MEIDRYHAAAGLLLVAPLWLWPAAWNGYPIVFADTGTYLSQAVHLYLGWDRPPFYSLFILPLHLTRSLWPVVVAQAALAAWVLALTWRVLADRAPGWTAAAAALLLSGATWLPWLVSEVLPDLFTPLLVLVLALLALAREHLRRWERLALLSAAALMIASQTSSLALFAALAACALVIGPHRWGTARVLGAPVMLATVALLGVNLAGHRRLSLSPYGDLFLLARLIDDGSAVTVLRHQCPVRGWRLCGYLDRLPMNSDIFLWSADSPVGQLGGHKALAREAGEIVGVTLRQQPEAVLRGALADTLAQMRQFASGDGLEPWPAQVTPWIEADFPPSTLAVFASARQQNGTLALPAWLVGLHRWAALAGIVPCLLLFVPILRPRVPKPVALGRRRIADGFVLLVLLALPLGAAITGALSGPHDRYQARIMWLPLFVGLAAWAGRIPDRA